MTKEQLAPVDASRRWCLVDANTLLMQAASLLLKARLPHVAALIGQAQSELRQALRGHPQGDSQSFPDF